MCLPTVKFILQTNRGQHVTRTIVRNKEMHSLVPPHPHLPQCHNNVPHRSTLQSDYVAGGLFSSDIVRPTKAVSHPVCPVRETGKMVAGVKDEEERQGEEQQQHQ